MSSTLPTIGNCICNQIMQFYYPNYLHCVSDLTSSLGLIAPAVYLFVINRNLRRTLFSFSSSNKIFNTNGMIT
uniref:7TM GPCR serpentine receptor class x (Srx) domain-containing protein n=1 Tax=Panagrellus redivivus TaxID=6233 RepID=A0A7E4VHS3_PANRE